MGLSAAQARLLTITARKSDCEFQSMTLSHQKIALSRNMERLSNEYQNSLNQTKLVYDYYGTNQSSLALDYGLLMTPSIYNDYYPKLVTDAKNRVVLNASYAAAARAAGIPAEGLCGTPDSSVRNAFIEALAGQNIITPTKAATIQATSYGNQIGLGSTVSVNASTTDVNFEELMSLIMAKTSDSASYGFTMGINYSEAYRKATGIDSNGDGKGGQTDTPAFPSGTTSEHFVIYKPDPTTGKYVENKDISGADSSQSVNLYDLLYGDNQYVIGVSTPQGQSVPVQDAAYFQLHLIGESENDPSFLNWMTDQFKSVLGGTNFNDQALQYAYNAIYDMIYPDSSIQDAYVKDFQGAKRKDRTKRGQKYKDQLKMIGTIVNTNKHHGGQWDSVKSNANNYLGFTYHAKSDGNDRHDHADIAINLNNIAKVFLTAFVEYQQGVENSTYDYTIGKLTDKSLYNPDRDDFQFTIVSDAEVDSDDEALDVYFYDALFNMICTSGWTENDQINDAEYMQEMLKSGMVYISSIRDDGHYYQGNYATDSYIREVTDDEAVARAQAKYNTEKAKIENKEDTIDLKMKNLDTEISALTQEYDTTKSVISKSIEKSFKRYDA